MRVEADVKKPATPLNRDESSSNVKKPITLDALGGGVREVNEQYHVVSPEGHRDNLNSERLNASHSTAASHSTDSNHQSPISASTFAIIQSFPNSQHEVISSPTPKRSENYLDIETDSVPEDLEDVASDTSRRHFISSSTLRNTTAAISDQFDQNCGDRFHGFDSISDRLYESRKISSNEWPPTIATEGKRGWIASDFENTLKSQDHEDDDDYDVNEHYEIQYDEQQQQQQCNFDYQIFEDEKRLQCSIDCKAHPWKKESNHYSNNSDHSLIEELQYLNNLSSNSISGHYDKPVNSISQPFLSPIYNPTSNLSVRTNPIVSFLHSVFSPVRFLFPSIHFNQYQDAPRVSSIQQSFHSDRPPLFSRYRNVMPQFASRNYFTVAPDVRRSQVRRCNRIAGGRNDKSLEQERSLEEDELAHGNRPLYGEFGGLRSRSLSSMRENHFNNTNSHLGKYSPQRDAPGGLWNYKNQTTIGIERQLNLPSRRKATMRSRQQQKSGNLLSKSLRKSSRQIFSKATARSDGFTKGPVCRFTLGSSESDTK